MSLQKPLHLTKEREAVLLAAEGMIAVWQFNISQAGETCVSQGLDHGAGLLDRHSPIFRSVHDQERGAYLVGVIDRRRGFQPIAIGPPSA